MKNANERDQPNNEVETDDAKLEDRRELVRRLGKFAVYAAPFTILAATGKAAKGKGHGSGGGPQH